LYENKSNWLVYCDINPSSAVDMQNTKLQFRETSDTFVFFHLKESVNSSLLKAIIDDKS
jgi:hypothetical protein